MSSNVLRNYSLLRRKLITKITEVLVLRLWGLARKKTL